MKSTEATLAQLVERLIRNQQVASSILAGGSILSPPIRTQGTSTPAFWRNAASVMPRHFLPKAAGPPIAGEDGLGKACTKRRRSARHSNRNDGECGVGSPRSQLRLTARIARMNPGPIPSVRIFSTITGE